MTFAERLRELRTEKKMSLNQVAEKIGVGRANIYKYEHGIITNVPPDRVHALANLFGVTRPYLMGWTDEVDQMLADDATERALDETVLKIAEELRDRPGMRMLFDAAKNCTEDDLRNVAAFISKFRKEEDD